MCTIVILRRPGHAWPIIVAANRDEMADRPWDPPARHWPDRPRTVAGRDRLAGGSWLGVNDDGVVAAVLNRRGTLGPAAGKRSRGELVLEALDYRDAAAAAEALSTNAAQDYRTFNLVIADHRNAYWLRNAEAPNDSGAVLELFALPPGLSILTARDRNDVASPRIRRALPRFEAARVPDPASASWTDWRRLLADRTAGETRDPYAALMVATDHGFGTVSSSLLALPNPQATPARPVWLFAAGPPDHAPFEPVLL